MNFRIKKLDIFLTKQFGLLLIGSFFICLFVLMMQFLWRYIDELIGKGLSMEVLVQFFGYMALMFVPQALPLAILLASLISFGNLGESSELTAIKAAGISLMKAFRPLIFVTFLISIMSFYFQNNVGPKANEKLAQLLVSMKQKSPELEIPEGRFYDGIPNCNIYVQKKDMETGMLYGIMIYRMTGSYEDQAIILADSGSLQATAEKKHLILNLHSGEWFENMQSQELGSSAAVPYRRETFSKKKIVLPYDGDFSIAEGGGLSNKAKAKSLKELHHDIDSIIHQYDSIGRMNYAELQKNVFNLNGLTRKDSLLAQKKAGTTKYRLDSTYSKLSVEDKKILLNSAISKVNRQTSDLDFKQLITTTGDKQIREHQIEIINKFTLALTCLIFFFIGAPLGAIIRKGGLGIPVIISVLVFITYFVLDDTGYRMARGGMWTVAFGKGIAPAVLIPFAAFVTYKANNDSMVFNIDLYRTLARRLLGLRLKRYVYGKEVIINNPDYAKDRERLNIISNEVVQYEHDHQLKRAASPIKVFFKYEPDHEIERISKDLEDTIDDLANTRDKHIIHELNHYPVLSEKAHTRPFERKWMNIAAAIILPVGIFLYFRMWMFRARLQHDLNTIRKTNDNIIQLIDKMEDQKAQEKMPQ